LTQTNVIVLRIRQDQADEFERMFRDEELPIWREYTEEGKFLHAFLTRVEFGSEEREGIVHYSLVVEVPGMAEHSEHDSDPRFEAFLKKARQLQPEPPLVFGGTTLITAPETPE
jgi:hypothetical protein